MISRAILILLGIVLAVPIAARACTCSPESPGQCPGLQPGDVVFLGTVTAVEDIADAAPKPADSSGPPVDIIAARLTRYHFQVNERFAVPG